jgi:hypothetical protein
LYKFALEFSAIISDSSEEVWGNENRKVHPSKPIATGSSAEIFKKEIVAITCTRAQRGCGRTFGSYLV